MLSIIAVVWVISMAVNVAILIGTYLWLGITRDMVNCIINNEHGLRRAALEKWALTIISGPIFILRTIYAVLVIEIGMRVLISKFRKVAKEAGHI